MREFDKNSSPLLVRREKIMLTIEISLYNIIFDFLLH